MTLLFGSLMSRFQQAHWLKLVLRYGLPLLAIVGVCVYAYVRHGFTWRALFPVLVFSASYAYHRFGPGIFGWLNYQLLFVTAFTLWMSFELWNPSDYSPLSPDDMGEYPHLAGLALGMVVGGMVALEKASQKEALSSVGWREWGKALLDMRHYWVSFSVVAASGYALFLPYAYAMHQIFAMNNYIFVPLVLFVITTFLVVAHKQAKAQLPD